MSTSSSFIGDMELTGSVLHNLPSHMGDYNEVEEDVQPKFDMAKNMPKLDFQFKTIISQVDINNKSNSNVRKRNISNLHELSSPKI